MLENEKIITKLENQILKSKSFLALVKGQDGTWELPDVSPDPVRQCLRECNTFLIWITNTSRQISMNFKNKCENVLYMLQILREKMNSALKVKLP